MKKGLVGIIVAVVMIGGYGAVATSFVNQNSTEKTDAIVFSSVRLVEEQSFTTIDLSEATSYLTTQGSYICTSCDPGVYVPISD